MAKLSILIVDDQPEILNALEMLLKEEYNIFKAPGGKEALEILKENDVAVILADQRMPHMTGVDFFSKSLDLSPYSVRMLITAYADINASIEAINKGQIYHYISKPWEPEELLLIVRRAAERFEMQQKNRELTQKLKAANVLLERENVILKQNIETVYDFSNIIGHSPKILQIFKLASKVVETPTTVLLLGETGTGKEMVARAIHYNGNRKSKMFVAQNCGALPDTLLESELFGHVKGAYTGAVSDRKGLFELAEGGTVFLDEIGDTTPALQLRLLRVLQEEEIKPIGGSKTINVNVRVIAATNKDLEKNVADGTFREDLYYRINVFPIILPPLRERRDDIPDLINHFVAKYTKKNNKKITAISDDAVNILSAAEFPGNIRELENEIERAVTLADDDSPLTPDLLSARFHKPARAVTLSQAAGTLKDEVEKLEISMITSALVTTHGNILKAAAMLKLSRAGLHKKLKRYNINPKQM